MNVQQQGKSRAGTGGLIIHKGIFIIFKYLVPFNMVVSSVLLERSYIRPNYILSVLAHALRESSL